MFKYFRLFIKTQKRFTMLPAAIFVALTTLTFATAEIVVPDDLKDYINELHDHCLKEMGLTEDDHKNYNIHVKDPKMMCYMKCLMTTSKWMNLDESIQYDFILSSVHPAVKNILLPALDKCRDIPKGTMECEKAYNFNMCLFNADPENWFFI